MTSKNNTTTVYFVRLGCDKNDIDAEIMAGLLSRERYQIVADPVSAEIIIINTCGFINSAKQESIDYILEAISFKNNGKCEKIIVTGCLAQRYAQELAVELAEVDAFVGVGDIDQIASIINGVRHNTADRIYCSDPRLSQSFFAREVRTGDVTAYVKISEGCDSHCSYCVIPQLRGRFRSRPADSIVEEVTRLAEQGVKEINLVAQNTTAYGLDFAGKPQLVELLTELLTIKEIRWYRLLYCYQDNITEELINLIAREDRIASYLDIPIQHSHPVILERMNRTAIDRVSVEWFNKIRQRIPNLTLRTTVMVGFPGEGEAEFTHLLDFINQVRFNHLGVFCFSAEEGTPAYRMPGQVDQRTSRSRSSRIKEEQQIIALQEKKKLLYQRLPIMLIEQQGEIWLGRGAGDAPEIDGVCQVRDVSGAGKGDIVLVEVEHADFDHIQGRMLEIEKRS